MSTSPRELAVTGGWVAVTLPLLFALGSAFLSPSTTWTVRIALGGFCLLAFSRPAAAFLVTTALLGFGLTLAYMADAPLLRVTELTAVASLAGCGIHAAWPGSRLRQALAQQLSTPVLLLSLAAIASSIVWQRVYQVGVGDPATYFASLSSVVIRDYLFHTGDFRPLVSAAALIEGLAIYVAVAALCRTDTSFFARSLRMFVAGGAGLGLLSIVRLVEIVLRSPEAIAAQRATAAGLRISPQIADVIAAGSYFSLCWLVSLGLASASRRWRPVWIAAGIPILAALYLTGSRSVIAAALAGLAVLAIVAARARGFAIARVMALAALAVTVMIVSYPWMTGRDLIGETAAISMKTRWELAQTTVKVIETRPLFGVGFNRHHLVAPQFTSPELQAMWQGAPNPHNDFLRIGSELGLIGMGLLIWIVVAAAIQIGTGLRATPDLRLAGLAGGLVAFLTTSLVSDPLSFREVSYAFWIALGLAVGHAAELVRHAGVPRAHAFGLSGRRTRIARWAAALALGAALVAAVPYRARQEIRAVDMRHVSYGFYDWGADEDGTVNRWSGPRATFYVDGRARAVEIPLSGVMPEGAPQEVEVRVDGRLANRVTVGAAWQQLRVSFPGGDSLDARRIDLVVSPTWVPARAFGNDDHRVLGVKVGLIKPIMPPAEGR